MDSNPHFFLGLAAAANCRMSFLIDASSFLVGTFSKSFLRPLSISLTRYLKLENGVLALCGCVVPLAISGNPSSLLSKCLTAAWTMVWHSNRLLGTIKKYFCSTPGTTNAQNFHLASIEDSFLFAHKVLL